MTKFLASINSPGRLTVLAALIASLAAPAMAAPGNVVISQVYGAGGNSGALWTKDFIELFNRSGADVSLGGMSVQYQSAAGTTWQATALPNVTLKPGQYFLYTGASGATGTDPGTGDGTGSLNLSGSTGKVALASVATAMTVANGGDKIIDMVGFGGADRFETTVAPAPSTTTSIRRAGEGCIDTDNNGADFSAGPVVGPRTTKSGLNVCSAITPVIVPTCPAGISTQQGTATSAILSATDSDSIVNSITLGGATAGITLSGFSAASADGGIASATLGVAANTAAGSYPVVVNFGNDDNQSASCTVNVSVGGSLTIPQIQGAAPKSSYANTVQTTQGVVTAKVGSGYFLQDPNGDNNDATSDAIFVFGSNAGVNVGDLVRVTGTVTEFTPTGATRSYTELTNATATRVGAGPTITETNVALPNTDLARFEAMLVRFTTPLTVNGNAYLGERGELTLSAGRREIPTNRFAAGSAEARAQAAQNASNIIVLDDGIFTTPTTIPYLFQDGTVRSGDTVTNLTGVLDFGAMGGGGAAFKLQPTVAPVFSRTNERVAAPVVAAGNVKVASANVLNFFTTFTNGGDAWGNTNQGCKIGNSTSKSNCRGADNMAEFVRQRDKIVTSLAAINADVVGLMEIQNNDDIAVTYLVDQLNGVLGAGAYAVVPKPAATGTDAIRVAMIYKPKSVSLVGGALSDGDSVNNRAPIAQTFKAANGGKFSLVVNHLKSKGGCGGSTGGDADSGDGQGCWNATRLEQVQRLKDYFLPLVASTAGDSDVLIVGDMNAYGMEDPIRFLNAAGYVNEIERFVRPNGIPYSYVFGAESGYLDHALASASLSSQVAGVTEWHNNADEPEAIDYNIEGTVTEPYTPDAFRASDHDPVIVSLNLAPTFTDVTASFATARSGLTLNRATGQYSATIKLTNTSGAAISGPVHLEVGSLPAGVTLANASGTRNGVPYITSTGTIAAGASVTLTTLFNNPSKVGINYTPTIYAGSF
jgi:predicted extracellular nuclease